MSDQVQAGRDGALESFGRLASVERGLTVLVTRRRDSTMQASVVNAGVLDHPLHGRRVVGLVVIGGTVKLANLRRDPRVTVVARGGWRWATVEGEAQLAGPDDPLAGIEPAAVPALLRDIYRVAGGGEHPDWDDYDRVMAQERRCAVLVEPSRIYGV
jgi:PPOX class probable F420-dependent enzyme